MDQSILRPRWGRAAVCVGLAAVLACGCAALPALPGTGADSAAEQTEALPYDASALNDGKLHLLSGYTTGIGSSVLCGSRVLCEGGPYDTLRLVEDTLTGENPYYLHAWSDPAAPSGRRCALYDAQGAEVLSFESEVNTWLTGSVLVVYNDTSVEAEYGMAAPGSVKVFDLSGAAPAECPVPANAVGCAVGGDYLAFTLYERPASLAEDEYDEAYFAHCSVRVQDKAGNTALDVIGKGGCEAINVYTSRTSAADGGLSDWVLLNYYDETGINTHSALCRPADGTMLDGYEQTCGAGTVSFANDAGGYKLLDLSGSEPVTLGEFDYSVSEYIPGIAVLWRMDNYCYELHDLTTGQTQLVQALGYTDDLLGVYTMGGELRAYRLDTGEQVLNETVSFSTPEENGYGLYSAGGNYFWLQQYGGASSSGGIKLCNAEGFMADLTPLTERYQYLSTLTPGTDGPLLSGSYAGPGGATLYDVLDCQGNVLLHGLGNCYTSYTGDLPDGIFEARRGHWFGWMDQAGNWVYCRNIFSSLSADDGNYYYW